MHFSFVPFHPLDDLVAFADLFLPSITGWGDVARETNKTNKKTLGGRGVEHFIAYIKLK